MKENYDAMSSRVIIMTIGDGTVLLITVQNDDEDDARCWGSLVMPRCHVIKHHFSLIFYNSLMTPPLAPEVGHVVSECPLRDSSYIM